MAARRLLFLHYGYFSDRGSEKVLLGILDRLDRKQFEAVLVCNHELLAEEARRSGVKTHIFEWPEVMIDRGYVRLQFVKLLSAIARLRKIIKNERTELVISNCGRANQTGLYAAQLTGTPCIVYIHAPYTKRYIYLYGLNRTNMAIFVSNAIHNSMVEKACFKSKVVIHNGIDIDKFHPVTTRSREILDRFSIDKDRIIIGQVGSLIKRKGVDILIEAGKLLADKRLNFHIVLVGSGPDESYFRQLVQGLRLSGHVTFYGNSDSPEYVYQNIIDINVLASRSESFGLTLAEGSACGLPCVGSNTGGIPEVILDNETGLLFRSGDAKDLADKLELLIINSPLREKMGKNGQDYIAENLSLRKQLDSFSEVLMNPTTLK